MHAGGSAFKVTSTGEVVHFNVTSPREVVRRAWERWNGKLFRKEMERLSSRRNDMGDWAGREWCQQLVRDVVHSEKFDGRAWALSVQLRGRHGTHWVVASRAWM